NEPFCFLDIGANQGLFSLIAGQNAACQSIVALEPVPDTHQRLSANLELNGLSDRATALNFGLSEKAETRTITLSKAHSGMATLGTHADQFRAENSEIMVKLATMTEVMQHLPEGLPIFVKIDVEGHEEVVIRQLLGSSVARRIMAIFYEQDDRWSDNGAITSVLHSSGFERLHQYGRGLHYDVLAVPNPLMGLRPSDLNGT
ncbi:MAG: FkbM family methyltransferase, partial [Pseudomonadota bacterium]